MSRALALVDSSDESWKDENASAPRPLLETKLYAPRTRSALVPRPKLIEAIGHGAARRLTIVIAPAGFGKTTLLGRWLADTAGGANEAGWVSLDPSENEPALFWAYFIAALRKIRPRVGTQALTLLQSSQPPALWQIARICTIQHRRSVHPPC